MQPIIPGDGLEITSIQTGALSNIDSSLIDINSDYVVDNLGNTISIGGGHDGGDAVVNATLTPVDDPTTTYTGADDPTTVTWW